MEITVISEEENPMLHRTDVQFRVSHAEATPDRLAVRDSLAARLNKDADEVVIRRLDTKFGMRETVGEAKVYEGPDFAIDVEQVHMLARNKIGAAAEAVEEPEGEAAASGAEPEPEPAPEGDDAGEPEESGVEEDADAEAEEEPDGEAPEEDPVEEAPEDEPSAPDEPAEEDTEE